MPAANNATIDTHYDFLPQSPFNVWDIVVKDQDGKVLSPEWACGDGSKPAITLDCKWVGPKGETGFSMSFASDPSDAADSSRPATAAGLKMDDVAAIDWTPHDDGASAAGPPAIVVAVDAPAVELEAAQLLADWCGKVYAGSSTAPPLPVVAPDAARGKPQFAIGIGATAALGLPASDVAISVLGIDGYCLTSNRTVALRSTQSVALTGAPNSTGTVNAAQIAVSQTVILLTSPLHLY